MVDLEIVDRSIELRDYDDDASLADLIESVDKVRTRPGLRTATCHLCGECCGDLVPLFGIDIEPLSRRLGCSVDTLMEQVLLLPEMPDVEERRSAIEALSRDMDASTAALVYEYNAAEPLTFRRRESGACKLQNQLLCTIYGDHPTACRLYVCNMGERLSVLYENVVRQGIWHSYSVVGWVSETDIAHNPFLGRQDATEVRLASFDVDLSSALESLFFYF